MAASTTSTSDFQIIPTANPLEFQIAITVPDRTIYENLVLVPTPSGSTPQLLAEYTPYSEFRWCATPPRVREFGSYRYVFSEKAGADATRFYFARHMTRRERNTPFKSFWSTRHYVWPAVLKDLYFVRSTFDISNYNGLETQNTPRIFPRFRYVPSTPHDSLIYVEQFLSDVPWPEDELRHPQPVPTDIDGSYVGVKVSFPRCLHRRVVLPELVPGASVIVGAGMEGSDRNGTPQAQIFPATNFADRVPFYIEDSAQPQRGMHLRERVLIKPPPQGEEVVV